MAEHQAVNDSEIKAAIQAAQSAIIEQQRLDTSLSQRTRLLRRELGERLRRELGERLPPAFADRGLDIEKINKIWAEHQREVRSVLAEEKSKTAKSFAALDENLRRGIENQRKALEQIAYKPLIPILIPLWTAWQIDASPGMPFASHIEASNNWAVITFEKGTDGDGTVHVSFWFSWQNPSPQPWAVINADTDLVLQGWATTETSPSWNPVALYTTYLYLYAQLNVYVGGAILQSPARLIAPELSATSQFMGSEVDTKVYSSRTEHHSRRNIVVAGGAQALFSVHFWADYTVDDLGAVLLDFESSGGFIKCPGVQLELLTPIAAT